MEVIDIRIVSTIKSIIIFVLSILLALETGFAVVGVCIFAAMHETEKATNERRNRHVNYRDYHRV